MTYKSNQQIYYIYKVKPAHKNIHKWKASSGVVISDDGSSSKIEIKSENKLLQKVNHKYIFDNLENAERKCEYYNHWNKYHKNINYRGRKKKKGEKHIND